MGDVRKINEVLEVEHQVLQAKLSKEAYLKTRHASITDLMDMFGGESLMTQHAYMFGLNATESADIKTGWDLNTHRGAKLWLDAVDKFKPLTGVIAFPCTLDCTFNVNVNYKGREDERQRLLQEQQIMKKTMIKTIWKQIHGGRHFLLENPPTSELWKNSDVEEIHQHVDVESRIGHSGAYGAESDKGPIVKAFRWM